MLVEKVPPPIVSVAAIPSVPPPSRRLMTAS